jgi:hypothetical protein
MMADALPVDAIERELERLLAQRPPQCGLKERPPARTEEE